VAGSETSDIGIIVRQGVADFRDYRRSMKVNIIADRYLVMRVTGAIPRGCLAWMIRLSRATGRLIVADGKVIEFARLRECEDFAPREPDCASSPLN